MKRPSGLSRSEIERLATDAIREHGGWPLARVFYKYDCSGCDRRVRVVEPNVLPRRAKCDACGEWTRILFAGYSLQCRFDPRVAWVDPDAPRGGVLVVRKVYTDASEPTTATEFER